MIDWQNLNRQKKAFLAVAVDSYIFNNVKITSKDDSDIPRNNNKTEITAKPILK